MRSGLWRSDERWPVALRLETCTRGVPFDVGQLIRPQGQRIVLSRIEVLELVDSVKHITHQFLEEYPRGDSHATAERAGHSCRKFVHVRVADHRLDPVR